MNPPLTISAIICTANRVDCLSTCLRALIREMSGLGDEIIIVDNGASPNARPIFDRYRVEVPFLRYVRESRRGLVHARNAGYRAAQGTIVAYLDDDAIALPGWASALRETYRNFWDGASPIVVGGAVELVYPKDMGRPVWLTDEIEIWLTKLDYGSSDRLLNFPDECLVGANFTSPKATLEQVGGFPADAGLQNYYDERCIEVAVESAGGTLVYSACARIQHLVQPERLTWNWFLHRIETEGYTSIIFREFVQPGTFPSKIWPLLRLELRYLARSFLLIFVPRLSPRFFDGALRRASNHGKIRALWQLLSHHLFGGK